MNLDEFIGFLESLKDGLGEVYTIDIENGWRYAEKFRDDDFDENCDVKKPDGTFTITVRGSYLAKYENLKIQKP